MFWARLYFPAEANQLWPSHSIYLRITTNKVKIEVLLAIKQAKNKMRERCLSFLFTLSHKVKSGTLTGPSF